MTRTTTTRRLHHSQPRSDRGAQSQHQQTWPSSLTSPIHQPEPEMDRLKRMVTKDGDQAESLRRHVPQVQQYQAVARLLQDAPVAHHRALRYVTDLKAALRSTLNHHDNVRRELTEEQATTYQPRHEIERYHHDAVARARQLEEFEAELQKKLPMEKELHTLRATHQSLRDKVVELEGSVADLQATNAEWAASHTQQYELIEQMQESAQNTAAFIDNRTRYFCRITWKLVQVSRDYRDLLQAHHQLQDDLRSTQRCKKQLRTQAVVRIVQLQAQMQMLRHEAATAQQQLQFCQAQHPTTASQMIYHSPWKTRRIPSRRTRTGWRHSRTRKMSWTRTMKKRPTQSTDRHTTSPFLYRMVRPPHPQMIAYWWLTRHYSKWPRTH